MNVNTEFKDTTDPLTVNGNVNIKVEKVQKDFFQVQVLDFMIGIFNQLQIREMVSSFDNAID